MIHFATLFASEIIKCLLIWVQVWFRNFCVYGSGFGIFACIYRPRWISSGVELLPYPCMVWWVGEDRIAILHRISLVQAFLQHYGTRYRLTISLVYGHFKRFFSKTEYMYKLCRFPSKHRQTFLTAKFSCVRNRLTHGSFFLL